MVGFCHIIEIKHENLFSVQLVSYTTTTTLGSGKCSKCWSRRAAPVAGLSVQISVWGGTCPPPMGGGLARDSRQSRELKKLGFQMLKKRLFVKQNHFIG